MSKHECSYCGTNFTRKTYLKKHENICKILHLNKRERTIETEELEILDNISLTKIVIELLNNQTKMQSEIDKLKNSLDTKRKSINVMDWLKQNCICKLEFHDFEETILNSIGQDDLDIVLSNNIISGYSNILTKVFKTIQDIPIKTIKQKGSSFYIYKNSNWICSKESEIVNLIENIRRKIIKLFAIWCKSSNHDDLTFETNVQKIMNSTDDTKIVNHLKRQIYDYTNVDLPMIE